ncbi:hypothetical protein EF384_00320 [Aerococcus agrisoli]|uniref:DUF4097 domain-containing protein n=1 Tax=Aerococcus agrisoli TaxID=2487350 RepID=A0A3N4GRC1_9LACT|nr:DUF4097 family beta strand repeat-containing protein [Aerococcus agrisoli]RPA65483.1 hypothetical protein EF384_00320 [Aerococcus agrisoli]
MSNDKERILKLVKDGMLTNEEAIILLENRANQKTETTKTEKTVADQEVEKDVLDDFYAEWSADKEASKPDYSGRDQKVAIQKELESNLAAKLTERNQLENSVEKTQGTNIQIDRLTEEINQLSEQIEQVKADIAKIDIENPKVATDSADTTEEATNETEETTTSRNTNDYDYKDIVSDLFNKTRTVIDQVQDKFSKTVKFEKTSGGIPVPKLITHAFEAAYDFEAPLSMVDIQIANGNVTLEGWDQPTSKMTVTGKLYGDFEEADAKTAFENRVNLNFVEGALTLNMISRFIQSDILLQVPNERLDYLKLRTISGPVNVTNVDTNDVYIQTVDGQIQLTDFTASMIEVDTKNGQVLLGNVNALDLVAKSLNGNQRLKGHVENVLMNTLNGDIIVTMFETPLVRAQVDTKNGNIKFNMPAATAVDGIAQTMQGEIMFRSDHFKSQTQTNEQWSKEKAFYHEVAGEKPYRVNLKTLHGNIQVKDDADIRKGDA